jgi:hypothetical protein
LDLANLLVCNSANPLGNSLQQVLLHLALGLPHHLLPPPPHHRQLLVLANLQHKLLCLNSSIQLDSDLDKLKLPLLDSKHHLHLHLEEEERLVVASILVQQLKHFHLLLHLHHVLLTSAAH